MKTMKTINKVLILTVVLFTGILFTSCDDDNEDSSIVGTWLQISGSSETIKNGVSEGVQKDVVDADNFTRITFNSDGTFSDFYSESYDGKVETSTDRGTYTIEGDILSGTYEGETKAYKNTFSLTDSQLVIYSTRENTNNGDVYIYKNTTTSVRQ